jgi:Secretion system C-terminal sorting domain
MQKIITKIALAILLISMGLSINAQTVLWPSATDTNQIKASKFTGGLNGWVTKGLTSSSTGGMVNVDSTLWEWDINDVNLKKASFFGTLTMAGKSPSASDGYVIFNSDYLDNRGMYNIPVAMAGKGKGQSASPHSSELISPLMDLSGSNNLRVSFSQYSRSNTTAPFSLTWSEDGGTTWKSPIVINNGISGVNNTPQVVILPSSVGTNKVRIKFIINADYYFWCIDDVKIIVVSKDMKVNSDFYCIPTNRFTPKTQIDPIFFQTDLTNNGITKATNVKLKTNIYSSTGAIIFTDSAKLGTLNPGDTAQNSKTVLSKRWTPPSVVANYTGSYRVFSDSLDDVPFNDSLVFGYSVTDTTFAKENLTVASGGIRPGTPAGNKIEWKWGNAYHISKGGWYRLSSTTGFVQNPTGFATKTVNNWVYKYLGDANLDGRVGVDERKRVAFGELILPTTLGSPGIFNTKLNDESDDQIKCVKLDTGTYLLMAEVTTPNTDPNLEGLFVASSTNFNYLATRFIADSIYNITRLHNIISANDATSKDNWSTGPFGGRQIGLIRLNIIPTTPPNQGCIDLIIANKDLLTDDNKLSIYPNPVALNEISVSVDIAKLSKNATLEIYDITGKYMSGMKITNVKNNNYIMNVNDLANGTYFVKLTTEEGHKTTQFSVQK